jgi:hypothetical protein
MARRINELTDDELIIGLTDLAAVKRHGDENEKKEGTAILQLVQRMHEDVHVVREIRGLLSALGVQLDSKKGLSLRTNIASEDGDWSIIGPKK